MKQRTWIQTDLKTGKTRIITDKDLSGEHKQLEKALVDLNKKIYKMLKKDKKIK